MTGFIVLNNSFRLWPYFSWTQERAGSGGESCDHISWQLRILAILGLNNALWAAERDYVTVFGVSVGGRRF